VHFGTARGVEYLVFIASCRIRNMANPSSIHRGTSTLEVTRTELRVGANAHQVRARSGPSASDSELLDAYLDFVRSMRNSNGVVWLRNEDLDVLSQVMGRSSDAIRADLEGRMTVARVDANRSRSKRRRLAFAAFGIAVVGSTLVVARPGRATSNAAAAKVGSALSIARADDVVTELTAAGIPEARSSGETRVGDSQVITRN
jgi:hypothetical protein